MPTYYAEDYEELTGLKPDGSPLQPEAETKVIKPPAKVKVAKATQAETKAKK